jgi:hypothetical protein
MPAEQPSKCSTACYADRYLVPYVIDVPGGDNSAHTASPVSGFLVEDVRESCPPGSSP